MAYFVLKRKKRKVESEDRKRIKSKEDGELFFVFIFFISLLFYPTIHHNLPPGSPHPLIFNKVFNNVCIIN